MHDDVICEISASGHDQQVESGMHRFHAGDGVDLSRPEMICFAQVKRVTGPKVGGHPENSRVNLQGMFRCDPQDSPGGGNFHVFSGINFNGGLNYRRLKFPVHHRPNGVATRQLFDGDLSCRRGDQRALFQTAAAAAAPGNRGHQQGA